MSKPRHDLLFVVNHPSPHMAALYRALARRDDTRVRVLAMADEDPAREWGASTGGFECHRLSRWNNGRPVGGRSLRTGIARALDKLAGPRTTVLLTLYTWPVTWQAARWLDARGRSWLLFCEGPSQVGSRARRWLRARLFLRVQRGARGVLAIGKLGRDDYARMGIEPARLATTQYAADVDEFLAIERPPSPHGTRFLSVGSLVPLKGHARLLEAFARVHAAQPNATLRIVGDGPERARLLALARKLGVADAVTLQGAVPYAARAEAFREADVLVHPTLTDGWGMVLCEAMAAGLPVISTPQAAAAVDLVEDGVNGFVAPARDFAAWMCWHAEDPSRATRQGAAARRLLQERWTPDLVAARLVDALDTLG